MEWISVLVLIVFGLALLLVEMIFVPGTTVVGILGTACAVFGVYLSFGYFGRETGLVITGVTLVVSFIVVVWAFRSKAWERFSLKSAVNSKFNEHQADGLSIGQIGQTISSLKPIGKAEFEHGIFEVRTQGSFLEENKAVRIVKVEGNKIIVAPNE